MKFKTLILLPLVILLAGCSISNESSAQGKVILGCDAFSSRYASNGYKTPDDAMRYFAEAARIDPGYIPLAHAAKTISSEFNAEDRLVKEWRIAQDLVWGVCSR
jgi:hypothetical protein